MDNILGQSEIDELLCAIKNGNVMGDRSDEELKKIKLYDFRRPDKISKDQLRQIMLLHETFSYDLMTVLSKKLRTLVKLHVTSVDQMTWEEYLRSIPVPTTLGIFQMGNSGHSVFEIDPALSFAMIDRMFGGEGIICKISRELSDIEILIMKNVYKNILDCLHEAWKSFSTIHSLVNIETNPNFATIVPMTEMMILVTFETKIGEIEGMMNLALPFTTIEDVLPKMTSKYISGTEKENSEVDRAITEKMLLKKKNKYKIISELSSWEILKNIKNGDEINIKKLYQVNSIYSVNEEGEI